MGALGKATAFWTGLSGPGRRLIIGAGVIFAVGLFMLFRLSGQTDYATLATTQTTADAAAITSELGAQNIPFRTRDGGTTIQVPAGQLDQARLGLASSNLLSGGGAKVGYEIFDKQGWGATDFTQRVNLTRAMEGELSRTIGQLDQVQSADVKIAMPNERLFTNDQKPTTASVVVNLVPGATLDSSQVTGVSRLVAMAVPGLDAKNVTITDTQGNILNGSGDDSVSAAANTRLALEAEYERKTQAKLDAMLAATLGPGKAVVAVNAVLDLNKSSSVAEDYDPRKEGKVPLQSDITDETLDSKGGTGGGTVGASANSPGNTFPATTSGNGTTKYTKKSDQTQNGVDRTVTNTENTGGTLVRQTVSVQVSDEFKSQLPTIQKAVEAAVGYDNTNRNDLVTVQAVPFAKDALAPKNAAGAASTSTAAGGGLDIMGIAKMAAAGIGLLMILMMARKSLKRRQSELEKALPELLARGPVPVAELTGGAGAAPRRLEGETKTPVERQMEDLALRKPDDMAKLMRSWLIERR
ncbi:MAG: flagellar basal-body MS-ring/collar protein FliF [Thermoleophilia bacterium]